MTLRYMNNQAVTYSLQGQPQLAEPLLREVAAALREKDGPDSLTYAGQLARLSQNLLEQQRYSEAEPLTRDCLAVRTKREPDAWTTFHVQSLLGSALLGQRKFADAEPLLVQGYEGLERREAQIPTNAKARLTEARERLVRLYDAWGRSDKAAEWRKRLEGREPKPKD
jgi:hypothetical protein